MIAVEGLVKTFGKDRAIRAVDGASFRAENGAITGLLGPNGAGKTTLLRILATLIEPDSGLAQIDGLDVVHDRVAVRSRIGVLSDARGLYARLTARENVRYYGKLHALRQPVLDARLAALFESLGIAALADRRTQGMSQGERMKIAIARALVHDPPNVLLDEPTNGLDVMSTRLLRERLRDMRAAGKCIVLSSHVMQEVSALCDTIVVVARGRIIASGTGDDLVRASGATNLEEAFIRLIGSSEGLAA